MLNLEHEAYTRSWFDLHGTSACALALATGDATAALARAEALGCARFVGQVGTDELTIPAVTAPDGSLSYFCDLAADGHPVFEGRLRP